jgi:hypothetical protein
VTKNQNKRMLQNEKRTAERQYVHKKILNNQIRLAPEKERGSIP